MPHPVHSRTAILAAMLEILERQGGQLDRERVAASIREQIPCDADRPDPELDALITRQIRRALVAEWIIPGADNRTLRIIGEGRHVLNLHRRNAVTLSHLIRRPRAQVLGTRGAD